MFTFQSSRFHISCFAIEECNLFRKMPGERVLKEITVGRENVLHNKAVESESVLHDKTEESESVQH